MDTLWSEDTRGLCPTCLRSVPATLTEERGQIWMTQTCPRHGEARALLASDSAEYRRLRQYVPDRTGANCCCGPGEVCGPEGQTGPRCACCCWKSQRPATCAARRATPMRVRRGWKQRTTG